jgi:putative membrane protein
MMYYSGYPSHWGWMIFVTIAMIVFWIAVIWAVAWTVTSAMQHRTPPAPRELDALAVLNRRYAAGELDDAEYERRREVLRGSS